MPDPFIESLTHDSIIVQLPYLKENARNYLERILSIFDQGLRISSDDHLLNIDEEKMGVDELLLVRRLTLAAASPEIRREMQVEDEILSEIEARDTTIMLKDKLLEQKDQELEQKDQELEQKDQELEQKDQELEQKDQELEQKDQALVQKDQELEQQKDILRSTIRNLISRNMSTHEIATILSISESSIEKLLSE